MSLGGIAAVVLAAGASSRFGRHKLLESLPGGDGRPLVALVVDAALAAGFEQVLVVVGHASEDVIAALAGRSVPIVHAADWSDGLSASLRAGLAAVSPECSAALFLLADQPGITPMLLHALAVTYRRRSAPIVVPTWRGRRGNPVLFDRCTFEELSAIRGDQGGRAVISAGHFPVAEMEWESEAIFADVDRPEDLSNAAAYSLASTWPLPMQDNSSVLSSVQGWLIDLDGVIYRGATAVAGAGEFIAMLRTEGTPFLFLTNNASRTPAQYASRLRGMGIPADAHEFYSSPLATAEYLRQRAPAGTPVLMIGQDGVREALLEAGYTLVTEPKLARYVVVGLDDRVTYADFARANFAIRAGATFIGTNADPTLPVEGGFLPGNGSLLAFLATASGTQPIVIGKPQRPMLELASRRLGVPAEACAMLGDRLDTDILGALQTGMRGVLILTGATTAEAAAAADPQPHLIVADHFDLMRRWQSRQSTGHSDEC